MNFENWLENTTENKWVKFIAAVCAGGAALYAFMQKVVDLMQKSHEL